MSVDIAGLRALSRAAFGQTYRLEIMLAIAEAEDGLVTLTDLARTLGLSTSNVQAALRSLVAAGLLSQRPKGGDRRKYLSRNPSLAWDWARQMRDQVSAASTDSWQ